ncbi:stage 0 sporulation protein [bacterium]|nr:stage 0 sporulation protein [bacterium]
MNSIGIAKSVGNRGSYVIVEFKGHRRDIFSNPYEFPFKQGDVAVTEADRGQDAGEVRCVHKSLPPIVEKPEFSVIRKATIQDRQCIDRLREYEAQTLAVCRKKIKHHNLAMKLSEAECRFDGLKLTFFFTADGRVDFRDLVRDLAGTFRTRIELRQIGARDETKRFEGYGTCGRRLCCVSFLNEFQPITTQMAKTQNLILNPSKLSGWCSRLKCCLAFEYDSYCTGEHAETAVDINVNGEDGVTVEEISD